MMKKQDLLEKKLHIERFRQSSSLSPLHAQQIQQSILNSWQRSEIAEIPVDRQAAPLNSSLSHPQGGSALQRAVQNCAEDLKHIAQQSDMVAAVGDVGSTIIWTAASAQMRNVAERVHFVEGGQWREELVGTNALALSRLCCTNLSVKAFSAI